MPLALDECRRLQGAMRRELERSTRKLCLDGNPRPYFISYLLKAADGLNIWGRYGSVFHEEDYLSNSLYAEVRVGSHDFDQMVDGGLSSNLADRDSFDWLEGPHDFDPDATRYALWKLTQLKYEEALQDYYEKKKILVEQHLKQEGPSFSQEARIRYKTAVERVRFPKKRWQDYVRDCSETFKRQRSVIDPFVRIRGLNQLRIFVNSEGSSFICQEKFFEVQIKAWRLAKDGTWLSAARYFYGRALAELPNLSKSKQAVEEIVAELALLDRAKPMEPYAGPALLGGLAAGLVFHEAVGHRLEGERMTARFEGQTFAQRIGQRILPEEVDIIDDPSLARWQGHSLFGHYEIDDEAVPSRPVTLVKNGVLESFLMSRSCVPGFEQSNGHGRVERYQETRDRALPQGILIKDVEGGETRTDRYDFQVFKGTPTKVFSVDPKTGRETLVRNVSFIGTPLAVIQRIMGFGKDLEVDNSYCYAESGSIPVSTIAPAMLVGDLELQKSTARSFRPPILPLPPMKRGRRKS